jgi:hypothetical protein
VFAAPLPWVTMKKLSRYQHAYKQFSMAIPKPNTRVRKGKNLFDLLWTFKDFGVGQRFTRKSWKYPEPCYFTVTKVVPTKDLPDIKRAKVWGVLTWRGVEDPGPTKMRCPLKREWRHISADEQPPTYPLDPEVHARAFKYWEGTTGEPAEESHIDLHKYVLTHRGVHLKDMPIELDEWDPSIKRQLIGDDPYFVPHDRKASLEGEKRYLKERAEGLHDAERFKDLDQAEGKEEAKDEDEEEDADEHVDEAEKMQQKEKTVQ